MFLSGFGHEIKFLYKFYYLEINLKFNVTISTYLVIMVVILNFVIQHF